MGTSPGRQLDLGRLRTISRLVAECVPPLTHGMDSVQSTCHGRPLSGSWPARWTIRRLMIAVAAIAVALWFALFGCPSVWTWYLLRDIESGGSTAQNSAKLLLATRGPRSVPALREALSAEHFFSRRIAADMLGALGPEAAIAVPDLIEAVHDRVPVVRISAIVALGRIGPGARSAVPVLASIAGSKGNRLQAVS